ncbi:beta-ketoacyl-ACP synthase 3 [Caldalkalibacillus salinus]|uniref:beta-ketoacyl-ACP synthase 3 n=1 Tax=Caldalkalibacillus salinus TaxID=2803787 RepID=UPI0019228B4C
MNQSKARITAIGSYVPERILRNQDLEQMVETNDEWITQRTGMKERRVAAENEFSSDLGFKAVQDLMARYDQTVADVDMVIVCTVTPDYIMPSVAAHIQGKLGIPQTGVLDLNAACAGFTYGLHVANSLISSGLHQKVLVIGAETMSKIIDYKDRSTCILFGDGAGAMLLEYDEAQPSFVSHHLGAKGEGGMNLYGTHLSTQMNGEVLDNPGYLVQNGREVYKWAVSTIPVGMKRLIEKAGLNMNDVDWFVPHSANLRMIESICKKVGFPIDQTLTSLVQYGNTSSASIPLALDASVREGKLKKEDHVLLYGFGGGLTHAGQLIKWHL